MSIINKALQDAVNRLEFRHKLLSDAMFESKSPKCVGCYGKPVALFRGRESGKTFAVCFECQKIYDTCTRFEFVCEVVTIEKSDTRALWFKEVQS